MISYITLYIYVSNILNMCIWDTKHTEQAREKSGTRDVYMDIPRDMCANFKI